ncbi:LysR family transcriptional regulator [Marinomonas dokdonensis]|uniref:LysR family transcriptional regulator n=1 Tax=Marinomonas dokdonensis TaxID=328224 RepID=UPI0040554A5D
MQLDIKHWQMLTAIDKAGTLRKAAQALAISQSALSHRLAEAERRLGGSLFEKEGRGLRLTPAGRAMTQTANQIIPILQRAEFDFQQLAHKQAYVVRFGIAAYTCYHWLPAFLRFLKETEPRLQLELVASATQNPLTSLQQGDVDVILAPGHLTQPGVEAYQVFKDELVLVTHPYHKLASKAFIEAADLTSEDYLTYSKSAQPGFEYERFIRPSGVLPHLVTVVEATDAILELVAAGFGVSILSRWAIQASLKNNTLKAVSLGEHALGLEWSALIRQIESENSGARMVASLLAQWFADQNDKLA